MNTNTVNALVKALFLGFAINNNKTKNVYWIENSCLMMYNNETDEIFSVYTPIEELNDTDWAIDAPKIGSNR